MSAIRIIPPTDDGEFPYERARALLEAMPRVEKTDTDIPSIVEAGKRFGWPKQVIDDHWQMMERGKCFDFFVDGGISCTLWEDNLFFRFYDAKHQETCEPVIHDLAKTLGCRVLRQ